MHRVPVCIILSTAMCRLSYAQEKRHCAPQWQDVALQGDEASKSERKTNVYTDKKQVEVVQKFPNFYFDKNNLGILVANRLESKKTEDVFFLNGSHFSSYHRQQVHRCTFFKKYTGDREQYDT